jgi:hypothetical protein
MENLNVETSGFAIICFAAVVAVVYIIGVWCAVRSWRRYHFSAVRLVSVFLLIFVPALIFPIYTRGESLQRKLSGNYNPQIWRIIKAYSWFPLIAMLVAGWIFEPVCRYGVGLVHSLTTSICAYLVVLFFVLSFIWIKGKLTSLSE